MLYSAAGVTLPSQHGAPPITTQRPIRGRKLRLALERQRDVGQRAERHQSLGPAPRAPGGGSHRLRARALARASGAELAAIAEAIFAVEPVRVLVGAVERPVGAGKDRYVGAANLGGQEGV